MSDTALTGTFGDEDEYENVDDLLGAAPPAVKFPTVGAFVKGTITGLARGVQTDPATGEVKAWQNNQPRQQVIVTLTVLASDPPLLDDETETGERRLFVKGTMVKPFRAAMAAAKVKGPRVGGCLEVSFTGETPPTKKGLNPAKVYTVTYSPPGT